MVRYECARAIIEDPNYGKWNYGCYIILYPWSIKSNILSFIHFSIPLIKHVKILDEQKKEKTDKETHPLVDNEEAEEKTTELGLTARRKLNTKNT